MLGPISNQCHSYRMGSHVVSQPRPDERLIFKNAVGHFAFDDTLLEGELRAQGAGGW